MTGAGADLTGSALVLLDCQEGVAGRVFADPDSRAAFVSAVEAAVATARAAGMPCVRVEVEFRRGHPEVAATNAYFGRVKQAQRLVEGTGETGSMTELADLLADAPRADVIEQARHSMRHSRRVSRVLTGNLPRCYNHS
jgi:nicotinamidase-related amidase